MSSCHKSSDQNITAYDIINHDCPRRIPLYVNTRGSTVNGTAQISLKLETRNEPSQIQGSMWVRVRNRVGFYLTSLWLRLGGLL